MVRAPCCEKMGLKKGPWTPEEDRILINYIQLYGHGNWRALPKQADFLYMIKFVMSPSWGFHRSLLRCGKSCRLRWTNYLRPDIKRGNFTREEEETIIKLHEMLGNRWSAIAARLPGRTDNEIKNVWHTHLKKRLKQNQAAASSAAANTTMSDVSKYSHQDAKKDQEEEPVNINNHVRSESTEHNHRPVSSLEESSSEISSLTTIDNNSNINNTCIKMESSSSESFLEIMDENFWSEVLSADNSVMESEFSAFSVDPEHQFSSTPLAAASIESVDNCSNMYDSMDFWYNLLSRAGELHEVLEI